MAGDAILLRGDAGPGIGSGHIARLLALGDWWVESGGSAVLLTRGPSALAGSTSARGIDVSDAPPSSDLDGLVAAARRIDAKVVAIDGYQFGREHHDALRATGATVLVIDDHGAAGAYASDVVLDQNVGAVTSDYRQRQAQTRLLLGSRYALLRREFWPHADRPPPSRTRRPRVYVTTGGVPRNELLDVLTRATVDAGAEPVIADGTVDDVATLMATCDLALSTAGSTSYELCCLGTPMALVAMATNQEPVRRELVARGAAVDLGPLSSLDRGAVASVVRSLVDDDERRSQLRRQGRTLVDGFGGRRVVDALRGNEVALRRARADDVRLLWDWANDPVTRRMSFQREPIPWETHQAWFEQMCSSAGTHLFIAEDGGTPAGQIRFDVEPRSGRATVSIAVEPSRRGQKLGWQIIDTATSWVFANTEVSEIDAHVRGENAASIRAFEQSGYVLVGNERRDGAPALHFVAVRTDGGSNLAA